MGEPVAIRSRHARRVACTSTVVAVLVGALAAVALAASPAVALGAIGRARVPALGPGISGQPAGDLVLRLDPLPAGTTIELAVTHDGNCTARDASVGWSAAPSASTWRSGSRAPACCAGGAG